MVIILSDLFALTVSEWRSNFVHKEQLQGKKKGGKEKVYERDVKVSS